MIENYIFRGGACEMQTTIKIHEVKEGLIIDEDLFAQTQQPIVMKGTVLTQQHIDVIIAFNIETIKVRTSTAKQPDQPSNVQVEAEQISSEKKVKLSADLEVYRLYKKAINDMAQEFKKWNAGIAPDVPNVRMIMLPLLTYIEEQQVALNFSVNEQTKHYMVDHSVAVGVIAFSIARKLGLDQGQAIQVGVAGTLMDCGMVKIPQRILAKPTRLTDQEMKEIKKHPVYSYQFIKDTPLLRPAIKEAILQHHERLDGSGYPRMVKGNDVSLYARILSVADVFHAQISKRVYREKFPTYVVLEQLADEKTKYDYQVIQALYDVVGVFSIHDQVQLSNGFVGSVVYVNIEEPFRPMIQGSDERMLDLRTERSLYVERLL